jgi:DNA-binding transcriptional LysR family regulator
MFRALTDELQRTHGIALDVRLVSSSIQAMTDFVLAGLGITLLPRFAVGHHLSQSRLRAVPLAGTTPGGVRAQLLVRTGRTLSHAAEHFVAHCVTTLESLRT